MKTAETSLTPSSNVTIIMIIIIIIIINYIIIMIIIFIVEVEPVLQDITCTGEELNRLGGANTTLDAWLDVVARGFWERQRSAFFDVRVCDLNADSYRDLNLDQIFRQHKTEKKRQGMLVEC